MTALPLIIEPEDLQPLLASENLLIIDLCNEINYHQGHIPGAIYVSPRALVCGAPPAPGRLPSLEQLTAVFSRIGLDSDKHVVVYDDEGGGWAGRFIWTLDVIGHKGYSYLNGGIHAWKSSGGALEAENNQGQPNTELTLTIHSEPIAEIEDILAGLEQPDFAIWDARGPLEYSGEKVLAQKGGHIPGAINCEWTSLMDPQRDLRIREDAESRLAALGLNRNQKIVTHCQSHHRSGFTYLVGKSLGFDIRGYHGSWSEWGNHPDTPVEV